MHFSIYLPAQGTLNNETVKKVESYLNLHKTELSQNNLSLSTTLKLLSYTIENQLFNYYPKAEHAYFVTLEKINPSLYESELRYELNHTMLLTDEETRNSFEMLLSTDYPKFVDELKLFWNNLNPNQEHDFNIRFFEHWERLFYAKKHFTFRKNSIITTDDRGPIYVRYGEPEKKETGVLSFSSQKIRRYLREYDAINTGWKGNQELNNAFLSNLISQYYSSPRYEVWIYKQNTRENLIYIFGNEGNTGQFGLRRSLDEMIPSNSFRARDELRRFNSSPALFLQLMMYEYFSMYDPFFSNAFSQLESQLLSIVNISSPEYSRSRKHIHESKLARSQYLAPQQQSDYLSALYELETDYKSYRTFTEEGDVIYYSFISIKIPESFNKPQLYPIRFSVFDSSSLMSSSLYDSVLHSYSEKNIILSYQDLSPKSRALNSYSEGHFLKEFFISTQMSHNLLQPITFTEQEESETSWVGDLILGKKQKATNHNYDNDLVPFNITMQNLNADTENLTFYIGIKNIKPVKDTFRYQIEIELERKGRKFLFLPLRDKSSFVYALTSETNNPSAEEIIEIDITDLSPGKYALNVRLTNSFKDIPVLKTNTFQIK